MLAADGVARSERGKGRASMARARTPINGPHLKRIRRILSVDRNSDSQKKVAPAFGGAWLFASSRESLLWYYDVARFFCHRARRTPAVHA